MSSNTPTLFNIEGKIVGDKKVAYLLGLAPNEMRKAILGWLLRERNAFVGGKKKDSVVDGVFRKKLMRKKTPSGAPWQRRVARVFRGRVEGNSINSMKLIMGAGTRGKQDSDFVKGLRILGSGGSISSSNFMIVPNYRNLVKKADTHNQFLNMLDDDKLVFIRSGGQVIYASKQMIEEGFDVYQAAVFFGTKRIDVKQAFDFEGDWGRRVPKAVERGQKTIDRAVKRLDKSASEASGKTTREAPVWTDQNGNRRKF
jgi:hypothetical protein